ncbi:PAS domain-containing protein [Xanthobacter sp. KR7-225]|uniref:PAS domain-containing protein n=1 Tax=Xanthobacter sp. KR7-225 TaxID=3156613 RepID=UPI0032B4FCDC
MTETKSRPLDLSGPRPDARAARAPAAFLVDAQGERVLEANPAAVQLGLAPGAGVPPALAPLLRALARGGQRRAGAGPGRPDATLARLRPPAARGALTFRVARTGGGFVVTGLDGAAPPPPAPRPEPAPVSADAAPLRFTFQADAAGRILAVSEALADALGPMAGRLIGATFGELEAQDLARGGATAAAALARGASFTGARVVVAGDPPLELELGAAPILGPSLARGEMRGFGLARRRPRLHLPPPEAPAPDPARVKVVPLRGAAALTPTERSAFQEIARTLAAAVEDWPRGEERPAAPAADPLRAGAIEPGPEAPGAGAAAEALLDRLPVALLVEQDGAAIHANRTFLKWSGHADLAAFRAAGGLAAALERGADGALRLVTATADRVPVEVRLLAAPYDGRNALVYVARRIDAEAPAADARAEALSQARREALDLVPWPVLLLEEDGLVLFANAAARRLLARTARELVGAPFLPLIAPADRNAAAQALGAALAAEGDATTVIDLQIRAGADDLVPARGALARGGHEDRLVCVVLAPRPAETAAQSPAAGRAESPAEAPAGTPAATAPAPDPHDAPAPPAVPAEAPDPRPARLAALARLVRARLGPALETLLPGDAAAREAPAVGLDGRTRAALTALRGDLDDLCGLAEAEPAPAASCDLAALARDALALLEPSARRRGVRLRAELPPADPPSAAVAADGPRLARLLRLMLEDALAASPQGASIALAVLPAPDDPGALVLEIADGGAPVDEVDWARALDPLTPARTADPMPRRPGGPLRLARLAHEAEALGGTFGLRRGLAAGVVAHLRLPRAAIGPAAP